MSTEATTRAEAERDRRIGNAGMGKVSWVLLAIHSTTAINCGDPVSHKLGVPAPHPADGENRDAVVATRSEPLGVGQSTEIVDR